MLMKYGRGRYLRFLFTVGGLVILCFGLVAMTQMLPSSPTPYDPAYYGWSNTLAGRRILAVLNTDLNPCALERKKTIVVETLDTVTAAAPVSTVATPSPLEVVLTLDPTGHTIIIERPFETKYTLIKYDMAVNEFWRKKGCQDARFASMFYVSPTTPVAPIHPVKSTPFAAK